MSKAGGLRKQVALSGPWRDTSRIQCGMLKTEGVGLHACAVGEVEYKQAGVRENITARAIPAWAVKLSQRPQDPILLP